MPRLRPLEEVETTIKVLTTLGVAALIQGWALPLIGEVFGIIAGTIIVGGIVTTLGLMLIVSVDLWEDS